MGGSMKGYSLVGRVDVLAALVGALDETGGGAGRVVLLAGEAGIGKTRLVSELLPEARARGFLVAQGRCDELDRSLPFAPMAQILADVAAHGRLEALVAVSSDATVLLPGWGPDPRADGPEEGGLSRSLARGLSALAEESPVLVVVEDLHWCDEATLATLAHLCKRVAALPLVILATYRPEDTSRELIAALAALERSCRVDEWKLGPLTLRETSELLGGLLGEVHAAGKSFAGRCHAITDGNPFFIEEVVGALAADLAGGDADPMALEQAPIPRSVQAAVWRRTSRLSFEARRLLHLAAIVGRRPELNLLGELAGLSEDELTPLVRELVEAQLTVEETADRIVFRHELTRRAVAADLLARERRVLHLIAAQALERRSGPDPALAGELAFHFFQAEDWGRARRHALRAGERALALAAPQAAADLFTLALEAAVHQGEDPDLAALRGRGRAHEQLGEFDRARDDLEGLLRRAGDASDSTAECQALLDLGRLWTSRDYGRAGDLFRRGLELARRLDRPSLLAATLNRVGNWHLNSERPNQALALHKEALDLARGVDDLAGVAESLDLLGTVHLTLGDVAAASRSYRDAAGRFRSLGNRRGLASALSMLAFCAPQYLAQPTSWTGIDEAEAVAGSREALELCRSMGWRSGEALCLVGLGTVLGQHGAYGGALEAAERARRLAEEDGHPYWGALSTLILGAIHLDLLNTHQASVHARAAFEQAGGLGSTYWQRTASGFLVGACLLAGDRAGARAVVDEVLPPGTRLDGGATLTAGLRHAWRARAEVALAEGKHVEALEIVGALQDSTVAATGAAPSPAFQLLRGQILVAAGRGGEAQALWREAIAESERCGTLPLSWRLHAALGRALRGQRRLEEADAHLSSAREQVRRLAAAIPDPLLRDAFVRASGRMLPGTSPRRAAKHTYAGLTEREREIASLVASGLTNPQIAAELVLSARTIEKHVENVLRKLGFDSRVQVAAWAVGAGLVVPRREAT